MDVNISKSITKYVMSKAPDTSLLPVLKTKKNRNVMNISYRAYLSFYREKYFYKQAFNYLLSVRENDVQDRHDSDVNSKENEQWVVHTLSKRV